jgi:hypothetical protein
MFVFMRERTKSRPIGFYHAVAFAAIANFLGIAVYASAARSPIATTVSWFEVWFAGYCSLAQEH